MSKFAAVFLIIAASVSVAAYAGQAEVDKCLKRCRKAATPDELPKCPELCEWFRNNE